jgi:hypothetical protein
VLSLEQDVQRKDVVRRHTGTAHHLANPIPPLYNLTAHAAPAAGQSAHPAETRLLASGCNARDRQRQPLYSK